MAISKDQDQKQPDGEYSQALEAGSLWSKVLSTTKHASHRGALRHIPTHREFVSHGQVNFLIRIIDTSAHRDEYRRSMHKKQKPAQNFVDPFLPHELDLFVADLSESHLVILNKFSVIEHHLLIITRAFEPQRSRLTLRDFQAAWTCLAEFDGLIFYNSGPASGSSQPHKHLQLIPLPMVAGGPRMPTEALIAAGLDHDLLGRSPHLPFAHRVTRIAAPYYSPEATHSAARDSLERYLTMLRVTGLYNSEIDEDTGPSESYNLLITRQWMLLVPRREEYFESISINALGFAGALLVRNSRQLQILQRVGLMKVLQHVTKPA